MRVPVSPVLPSPQTRTLAIKYLIGDIPQPGGDRHPTSSSLAVIMSSPQLTSQEGF